MAFLENEIYRHYKGGKYFLWKVAETHEHNGDFDVVYLSITHAKFVTRPLRKDSRKQDSWTDLVMWPDGQERQRFVVESELPKEELEALEKLWKPAFSHYPPGMGEESRRLHREYNRLLADQARGVKNGPEVVRLTDECAAKGIILVPGGENL